MEKIQKGIINTNLRIVTQNDVGNHALPDEEFLASYHIPGQEDRIESFLDNKLSERDDRMLFDEVNHVYYVDGIRVPISATTLLGQFHSHFDADDAIKKMRGGRNWRNKQLDYMKPDGAIMTNDEIKEQWAYKNKVAQDRGTLMHWQIEQRLNGRMVEEEHSKEFLLFSNFARDWLWNGQRLVYRTEANLFHIGLRMAGQADLICMESDGTLSIFDWKRSKEIRRSNRYQSMMPPLENLHDCNYEHYALQLNLYRYVLETEYDRRVSLMYLVILHPSQLDYEVIPVPDMSTEINRIVDCLTERGCAGSPVPGNAEFPNLRARS